MADTARFPSLSAFLQYHITELTKSFREIETDEHEMHVKNLELLQNITELGKLYMVKERKKASDMITISKLEASMSLTVIDLYKLVELLCTTDANVPKNSLITTAELPEKMNKIDFISELLSIIDYFNRIRKYKNRSECNSDKKETCKSEALKASVNYGISSFVRLLYKLPKNDS
jgi:hypothetical protein